MLVNEDAMWSGFWVPRINRGWKARMEAGPGLRSFRRLGNRYPIKEKAYELSFLAQAHTEGH